MAFLGSILPAIGKFGTSVIKDIVAGKNVGQSLKTRGLETVRNLPVIGQLAEPLVEKLGDMAYQSIRKKLPKQHRQALRKVMGARLTPAGVERAKIASKIITGKDYIEDIKEGRDIKDVVKEAVGGAKAKKGKVSAKEISEIAKIVEELSKKKGRKKGKESARVKRDRAERAKYDKAHGIKK